LIKDTFINHILLNFDRIIGTPEGIDTEGLKLFGIVISKLKARSHAFEHSIQNKILSMGCDKDKSKIIHKIFGMEVNSVYTVP